MSIRKIWSQRWVRIIAYFASSFAVLTIAAIVSVNILLRKNNISIGHLNFDFAGRLTLADVKVNRPDLFASIGKIYLGWNWRPLFSKRLSGDSIYLENANIKYYIAIQDSVVSEDTTKTDFSVAYRKIKILNSEVIVKSATDSIAIKLPHFEINDAEYDSIIHVGGLLNDGFKVYWKSRNDSTKTIASPQEESTKPFSLSSIPQFTVDSLLFKHCDFIYQDETQKQSITDFAFHIDGIKSKSLLNASVKELSLIYQDSLKLSVNLNKISVNEKESGTLHNLAVNFPWFAIDIPQLTFATQPNLSCDITLKKASINTSLLKFLSSSAYSLASNENINFSGTVHYKEDRVRMDFLHMSMQGVNLLFTGYADVPGKNSNSVDVVISNLKISSIELAAFMGLPLPKELAPLKIGSTLEVKGPYTNLTVLGDLLLNESKVKFVLSHQQQDSSYMKVQADFVLDELILSKFYYPSPAAFDVSQLQLKSSWLLNKDFFPEQIDVTVQSDSLHVESLSVVKPEIAIQYQQGIASGKIIINNDIQLKIDTLNLCDSSNIKFAGSILTYIPNLINLKEHAGNLSTSFNGYFKQSENGMELKTIINQLTFKGATIAPTYNGNGFIQLVSSNKERSMAIKLGNGFDFNFNTSEAFEKWVQRSDRWDIDYPDALLNLKLDLDSLLVKQFTGYNGELEISKFSVKTSPKSLEAIINIPIIRFEDFKIKDIETNHSSKDDRKTIRFTAKSIENPATPLSNTVIDLSVRSDSVYSFTFDTYLPEVKDEIDCDLLIEVLKNGYKIVPDESKPMKFGNQRWVSNGSEGLVFDKEFEMQLGHLILENGKQKINALSRSDSVHISIKDFNLNPLLTLTLPDSTLSGILNLNTSFHTVTDDFKWTGSIDSIFLMEANLGQLKTVGELKGDKLQADANLINHDSKVGFNIFSEGDPIKILIESSNFDLSGFNALKVVQESDINLQGKVDGKLDVTYKDQLKAKGFLTLNKMKIIAQDGIATVKADEDTIWIKDYVATAHKFKLRDIHNNVMEINGHYDGAKNEIDFEFDTKRFRVIDAEKSKGIIRGLVEISNRIHIKNPNNQISISGQLNTLPNSNVTYVYTSSNEIVLDDRTKEVEFLDFNKLNEEEQEIFEYERAAESPDPILWDVTTDIGSIDVTVLLNEAAGEFFKMTATGNLLVKTGSDLVPMVYGKVEGQSGRLVYDLPMVSDLDFTISSVAVNWNGDLLKPRFSFEGSEVFRITPNDISATFQNNKDRVPIQVIAKVEDSPIDNFDIHFDLKSSNQQVATWIQSQPENTREVGAISLMVFGKVNTDGTGEQGNALVQGMVTKMNELSRKNLKNADLSFYVDSQKAAQTTTGVVNNMGYSFSKPLFNKRFKITLGGSVDLSGTQAAQSKSTALGSIALDYVVKKEPDITLSMSKRGTYDGVINGQIDESSIGFTFIKRFKNLFHRKEK